MNNFWHTLENADHDLHKYHTKIENYLFKESKNLVVGWMLGKYTSEQIHDILENETGVDSKKLYNIFVEEAKHLDISDKILSALKELKKYYCLILITDNMDSFDRFTLPANKQLKDTFDEIHNSYAMKQLKSTNNGEYFIKTASEKKANIQNCLFIDDSVRNCNLFTSLGGTSYNARDETLTLEAISQIKQKVIQKWEWQY